ncbi:glycolate oxidase subunit GlcF [Aestuariivirga sp.]|uniref:glycolate oxidase subunit GlcF n=1 Tax=Aestuariivirga sp. TaxID=2650926 RepID=UPI0039E37EE9
MQTNFTAEQLSLPRIAESNTILRKCVHCGFCTATCPTYVLLGDELDSPRGRIYLIKNMLESGEAAKPETVRHIDRCLSCLSCMTTCPSGVNYMHLIDEARAHVEETYTRPLFERLLRGVLAFVMPRPSLFRLSLIGARLGKPFAGLLGKRVNALSSLVPPDLPRPERFGAPGTYAAEGKARGRVALLMGCVQSVLDPAINAATIRLLTRLGFEVVVSGEESCCGSLTHHMGKEHDALTRARRSVDQWTDANVEAVIITASGCGTTVKDYGHMLRLDPAYAEKAKAIAAKAKDITEFLDTLELPQGAQTLRLTYHSACSMQHGQKITRQPLSLLRRAGFTVSEVPEGHLCCGSAGTYNILQPDIASRLRDRKLANIATTQPQAVATGNIGCMAQLAPKLGVPILHTVELLDWAYGGPIPDKLATTETI